MWLYINFAKLVASVVGDDKEDLAVDNLTHDDIIVAIRDLPTTLLGKQ